VKYRTSEYIFVAKVSWKLGKTWQLWERASEMTDSREELMLLNVPDDVGVRLRKFLAGDEGVRLEVAFAPNGNPEVYVDGMPLHASLTSLPTVVEVHKSIDGSTFFKAGEIGRVLVTQPLVAAASPAAAELPDGLTPPAVDIRRRKWRKRPARDQAEVEHVAVELEALRGGSLKPEFELIKVEQEVPIEKPPPPPPPAAMPPSLKMKLVVRPPLPEKPAGPPASSIPAAQPAIAPLRLSLPIPSKSLAAASSSAGGRPADPPPMHMQREHPFSAARQQAPDIHMAAVTLPLQQRMALPMQQPQPSAQPSSVSSALVHPAKAPGAASAAPRTTVFADPVAQQQAHAELQRHLAELAKFRTILTQVSRSEDRARIQAKIEAVTKACDAARDKLKALGG
jgi:hypothetical protein